MKRILGGMGIAIAGLLLFGLPTANAVPTLTISDGVNPTVIVADGSTTAGAVDQNSLGGAVTWIGSIGVWFLNVDTGITKPQIGSATQPMMDLNFVDASSGGPGATLTLTWTDSGFTVPAGAASIGAAIGGITMGTVTYQTLVNGSVITSQSFTPGSVLTFGGSTQGNLINGLSSGDIVTQIITIQHAAPGTSSGDSSLSVPDGGVTAMLLGVVLLGVDGLRRKLQK